MNKITAHDQAKKPVNLKNKLAWQCRRGMLELDVILIPFLEQHFESLTEASQNDFVCLLEQNDPDLFAWFMGHETPSQQRFKTLIALIKQKLGIKSAT